MKIAVIELEDHAECIYSLVKILSLHTDDVRFFLSKSVYDELSYMSELSSAHFDITLMENTMTVERFMKDNFYAVDECSILFFTTVQQKFRSYPLSQFKGTKILRIHNAYTFSDSGRETSIDLDPYILWKDFSFFMREVVLQRFWNNYKKFKQEIDYFVFPDECILAVAKEKKLYPNVKILGAIPLACMNQINSTEPTTKERFKIVVTGVIDQRRKDYELVLKAVDRILDEGKLDLAIELILLGKPKGPYGKSIISAFRKLESDNFRLKTFTQRIAQAQFESEMSTADILLAPIQIETRYKYFKETYGQSKQSGSISDLIRYAKPLVVPDELILEDALKPYVLQYKDQQDLEGLLTSFVNGTRKKSFDFGKLYGRYSKQTVYDDMITLLHKTIK